MTVTTHKSLPLRIVCTLYVSVVEGTVVRLRRNLQSFIDCGETFPTSVLFMINNVDVHRSFSATKSHGITWSLESTKVGVICPLPPGLTFAHLG